MPLRRQTHPNPKRASAGDDNASIAQRVVRLEVAIHAIQETLDVQFKRIAALQAEVDHLAAKQRG